MMPPIFSLENIYRQYLRCRRNKRNTLNALRFEYRLEENLMRLKEDLEDQTYYPSRSVCFAVNQPKPREIFAADFRDRIVHHILVDYLERIWEPKFIFHSYACRKEKGIHRGVKRLQGFIRKVTQNGNKNAYFLKLDIENFFMNIDKDVLYALIAAKVRDEKVLYLAKTVIYHDCTKDYVLKGDKQYLEKIAPQKSLFYTNGRRGLPIGNLTSQFFANVYLDQLDQFVKHSLKCRYYLRYCDDFVMLTEEKDSLLRWKTAIEEFLKDTLKLRLNQKRQSLQPVSNGIDFLGYIVRGNYLLVRKRVVNNFKSRLSSYERRLIEEKPPYIKVTFDYQILAKLMATLSSYLGHFKWANSFRLQRDLMKRYNFLESFFKLKDGKFARIYEVGRGFLSLKSQFQYFKRKFSGDVLLFQVGSYYEFFQNDGDGDIGSMLKLKRIQKSSIRKVHCGFPVMLEDVYINRLKRFGKSVTVIGEGDRYLTRVKQRLPKYRLVLR
jgi:RNA-directed DNA polymerase